MGRLEVWVCLKGKQRVRRWVEKTQSVQSLCSSSWCQCDGVEVPCSKAAGGDRNLLWNSLTFLQIPTLSTPQGVQVKIFNKCVFVDVCMYDLGLNSKLPILGCSLKKDFGVLKLFRENVVIANNAECQKKKSKNVKNVNTKTCKTVNDVQKNLLIVLCRY